MMIRVQKSMTRTFVKECGTCSVSHWFLCRAVVILECRARRKEQDVYRIKAKCGTQVGLLSFSVLL